MRQPSPWMMTMTMLGWAVQLHAWWASEWHLELATLPPLYKQQAEEQQTICRSFFKCAKIATRIEHRADLQRTPQNRVQGPRNNFWSEMLMNRSTHILWVVSANINFKALCLTETATEIWLRVMWAQECFRDGNWNASSIRKGLLPLYATWPTTWMPRNLRCLIVHDCR